MYRPTFRNFRFFLRNFSSLLAITYGKDFWASANLALALRADPRNLTRR
jgi:hypothetical protein